MRRKSFPRSVCGRFAAAVIASWLALLPMASHAEFLISSAIIEFTAQSPPQQDIELASHSKENNYIVTSVSEVHKPGTPGETREAMKEAGQGLLLVTPDKTILTKGSHTLLRFVRLGALDDAEHIYRVAVTPVVRGVGGAQKMGLKLLIGYEVLVIFRPAHPTPHYSAMREGQHFRVANTGNTNILFQNGQQCRAALCTASPVLRVYPGGRADATLPLDAPVAYAVWDGETTREAAY